jgi:hypothetical protein
MHFLPRSDVEVVLQENKKTQMIEIKKRLENMFRIGFLDAQVLRLCCQILPVY